jgi:hypothetical protein
MWETAWAEAALARRFVQRLGEIPVGDLRPMVPPVFDQEPYLSSWTNIQAALGNAPAVDRERAAAVAEELDRDLEAYPLPTAVAEAARRAVRALLARRWLGAEESFTFVYEPFESVVPLTSLHR